MISRIELIPETKTSYCFATATSICSLSKHGYEESEYYMYGHSNVYETGEGKDPKICIADAPYINRFIVRAPKDPNRFSGNVVVEIINPSSGMEIDRMWILGYRKFLRDGDIYVGITSKPNTLKALKRYNQERYGRLSWENPRIDTPFPFTQEEIATSIFADAINHEYETGLFWDMLTDLSHLLRADSDRNPIRKYLPATIVLTGWSQSACYLRRYVNVFANTFEEKVFDGYFAAGGVSALTIPLNQYETFLHYDRTDGRVTHCNVPFMSIQTESDAAIWGTGHNKLPDSDNSKFPYRLYEFAGGSHDTIASYVDYYAQDNEVQRVGKTIKIAPIYVGQHEHGNDYPYEFLFCAAYRNLFYWINAGVAPRSASRFEADETGCNYRDGFGNSIGGVRTCIIDFPTAHYCSGDKIGVNSSAFTRNSDANLSAFGYTEPFSAELLKELYSNLENYRTLCEENTAVQVARGFILKEDACELVEYAVSLAAKRGLN